MPSRNLAPSAFAALLTAIGVLAAPSAQAQSIPSPYRFIDTRHEISLFAGSAGSDRGQLRLGPGGGPVIGVRYGFELTETAAVEGGAFYLKSDREVYDPSDAEALPVLLGIADYHVASLEARARLNLTGPRTWNGFAPYLAGGAGVALGFDDASELEEGLPPAALFDFGPSLTATLAAGVRWLPSDRFGVRLEGNANIWKVGNPAFFRTLASLPEEVSESEWAQWTSVTVGASYRF